MATCTLRIGDRVVVASPGGALDVEYALFDPSEVEIAATGVGRAQEVGYQTTAGEALARLRNVGFTWPLLVEAASAMQPVLAVSYARGSCARSIATALGPAELFEGSRYDSATKVYQGRWLDLPSLGMKANAPGFAQTVQGLYLLALLREVSPQDPVRLVTRELMATARSGSRSYRRHTPSDITALPRCLRQLAAEVRAAPMAERVEESPGMSSPELIDLLRDRVAFLSDPPSRDRLRAIEKAIELRERPPQGGLADPEVWALERQLSEGRADGVVDVVLALEASKGEQPALEYLRLRAMFLGGRENPRGIAERVAALAISTPSSVELLLLATEAWNAAGEPNRALLFAGDLLSDGDLDAPHAQPLPDEAPPTAEPPQAEKRRARSSDAPTMLVAAGLPLDDDRAASVLGSRPTLEDGRARIPEPALPRPVTMAPPSRRAPAEKITPRERPAPLSARRPPSEPTVVAVASERMGLSSPASAPRPVNLRTSDLMRGASQPSFRPDSAEAHVHVPRAPSVPALGEPAPTAMTLPLPEGLKGVREPAETLPRTYLDARVQFTFLARELGRDYDRRLALALRADRSGIEAMQRVLRERYGTGALTTAEAAADAHRHGAFLSEVLARSLGAFWVDIEPRDVGYWAMIVPPSTRVTPFGRVLRFIAGLDADEDLASYFTELLRRAVPDR